MRPHMASRPHALLWSSAIQGGSGKQQARDSESTDVGRAPVLRMEAACAFIASMVGI